MKKIYLAAILVLVALSSNAQNQITIAGKIVNKQTKEPQPYVIVALTSQIGAYTDLDGQFKLTFDSKFAKDTIKISYVGYKPQRIPVSRFLKYQILLIELEPEDYNIDNVYVKGRSQSIMTIIKNVNDNIPKNYPNLPYNYIFDYQSVKQKNNTTQKVDASVTVYDKLGYYKTDYAKILSNYFYKIDNVSRNYKVESLTDGYFNLLDILKCDIVKFRHNVLEQISLTDFQFTISHEKIGQDSVWSINFNCLKPNIFNSGSHNTLSYSGRLVVNKNDFAVVQIVSQMNYSALSPLGADFFADDKSPIKKANVSYTTTYKKVNKFYIVDEIRYSISYEEDKNSVKNTIILKNQQAVTESPEIIATKMCFVE